MTTERALLQTILDEPDNDDARLVYSDWLDDHNQEARAEFIRAQVYLAQNKDDSPQRRETAYRAKQLLDEHEESWLGNSMCYLSYRQWSCGFLDTITIWDGDLHEHAKTLFAVHPVSRLRVEVMDPSLEAIASIPESNHIRSLDLSGAHFDGKSLDILAKMPNLPRVEILELMFCELNDGHLQSLQRLASSREITLLGLGGNPFTVVGQQILSRSFGDALTLRCQRASDYLYRIDDDHFTTGLGKDHTQLFFEWYSDVVGMAVFDFEGNLLSIHEQAVADLDSMTEWNQRHAARNAVQEELMTEWEFEEAPIEVKRFEFDEKVGIRDFNWWADVVGDPTNPERQHHDDLEESVRNWLRDGQFEWLGDGENYWVDRTGEVTDT